MSPVATVHAAAWLFCRLPQKHGDGIDYLSRHDLEECGDHEGFNVEHTGMGSKGGGEGSSPMPDFNTL